MEAGNTHRKILSQVFSVWDPRGQISPFTIRAKMYLQGLWMENGQSKQSARLGWDTPIDKQRLDAWFQWFQEAEELSQVVLPRPFRTRSEVPGHASLMVFPMRAKRPMQHVRISFFCTLMATLSVIWSLPRHEWPP